MIYRYIQLAFSLIAEDSISPRLLSYTMDMDAGRIILTFSEDIEQSNVNTSGIVIQGAPGINLSANTSLYYRLTSTSTIVTGTQVIISLVDDFAQIQIRLQLATHASNTYISMDRGAFTDRATPPNAVQLIPNEDALMVSDFIPDTTPPELLRFSLNLEADTLILTYSESVLISSFIPGNISISSQRGVGPSTINFLLTGGRIVQSMFPIQSVVVFQLNSVDASFLERSSLIATTIADTYLSVNAGLAYDTNGIPSIGHSSLQADEVIPDTMPPSVVAFDFDLDSAVLTLEFNDVVDASTVNGSAITLQSFVTRRLMESRMLTVDGVTTSSPSGSIISLQLNDELTNDIKRIRNLCTSSQNCYMTISQYLALDPSGLSTTLITDGSAIVVRNFIEDLTSPFLLLWTLDMNAGIMELIFSETVDVTTFQFHQFTLQGISQMYSLTRAMSSPEPAAYVVIELNVLDLNEIKRLPGIGTNLNDTYLSVGSAAVFDMNGNGIIPIPSSDALLASVFIADRTSPSLLSFSLDIASGVLTLTFSETVSGASFTASAITLVNGQVSMIDGQLQPTANYTLTGGSWSTFDSTVIEIHLSQEDFSAINSTDNLATSAANTYIIAASMAVFDTNGNGMVPIALADSLPVSDYCSVSCSATGKIIVYIARKSI
jgi:hypothetical protein